MRRVNRSGSAAGIAGHHLGSPCITHLRRCRRHQCAIAEKVRRQRTTMAQCSQNGLSKAVQTSMAMLLALELACTSPASALLKGNPRSDMPRSPEAALRRSVPQVHSEMFDIQGELEEVAFQLRIPQRKRWDKMQENVEDVQKKVAENQAAIFEGIPESEAEIVSDNIKSLNTALQQTLRGIEYKDTSYSASYLNAALNTVASIEISQATSLPYSVPREYSSYPRLTGRSKVKLTIKKTNQESQFISDKTGEKSMLGVMTLDLDGFSAPLTTGKFLTNVKNGLYNNVKVVDDFSAIVVSLESEEKVKLPLEIMQRGEFSPSYNISLDVLDAEYPVLPLSIYGAIAMSHSVSYSSGSSDLNFFIYKFEPGMSGLSGLSFDEGQFSVMGYVTEGADVLSQVENGDVIEKVEIVTGENRLIG